MTNGKQKRKEFKEQAQRLTYIDTLNNQTKLRKWVEELRKKNKCLQPTDRTSFMETLSKALCEEGTWYQCYLPIEHGKIPLTNVHHLGELMTYKHTNVIKIKSEYSDEVHIVDISVLWDILLDGLLFVFPFAQRQAHIRSAEREKYERGGALAYEPTRRY